MFLFKNVEEKASFDLAIVGAGIAGLYCAYRIAQKQPDWNIAIFERLNRTGGRLDSDLIKLTKDGKIPKKNAKKVFTIKEEQGGMRFNNGMEELMALIEHLDLCEETVPFPMSSNVDGKNTNRYLFRGREFTAAEAKASKHQIWGEIYDLEKAERGLSPDQLIENAFNRILQENDYPIGAVHDPDSWTDIRENCKWNGSTLNEWHIWSLLSDMGYSEECIRMMADTTGFPDTFKAFTNAGCAFQALADFPEDPEFYTFKEGFSALPKKVIEDMGKNVKIYLSTNLNTLHDKDGQFELRLSEAEAGHNATPFKKKTTCVYADRIILATATKGIQDLFYKSPALYKNADPKQPEKLWNRLNEVEGAELMKVNLYFRESWWLNGMTNRPAVQFGPNFTTLPINAIYPFYALESVEFGDKKICRASKEISEEERETPYIKDDAHDNPAALTLYCDFNKTPFWEGLQNIGPEFTSELQRYFNKQNPKKLYAASQTLVDELMKQLEILFGATNLPKPILSTYRAWNGKDDYEYAFYQWRLNAVDSETRKYLAKPYDDKDLHFCNESISDMQAWVNGSLRSADLALAHFGLKPLDRKTKVRKSRGVQKVAVKRRQRFGGIWG